MSLEYWLGIESFKRDLSESFPQLGINQQHPSDDITNNFKLRGYRLHFADTKYSHEMGLLDNKSYLSFDESHEKLVDVFNRIMIKMIRKS